MTKRNILSAIFAALVCVGTAPAGDGSTRGSNPYVFQRNESDLQVTRRLAPRYVASAAREPEADSNGSHVYQNNQSNFSMLERLAKDQSVLAIVWHGGPESVGIRAVDAQTGETLGQAETGPAAPGAVSTMVIPVMDARTGYLMFQPNGKPLRAETNVKLQKVRGPLTADALAASWGRTFELGSGDRNFQAVTEPLVLTEAHTLALQVFNRGGRAALIVRGWDPMTKTEIVSESRIVEGGRGARIEFSGTLARGMQQLVQGKTANALMQIQVVVEPLDGAADLVMTAEGQSPYGDIVLERGYTATDDLFQQ